MAPSSSAARWAGDITASGRVGRTRRSASSSAGRPLSRAKDCASRRCLVVAAGDQPATMQRHRHQPVGLPQQRHPGARHKRGQRPRGLDPVAVFERQQDASRLLVIAERGAGDAPRRRIRDAAWAEPGDPALVGCFERDAALGATRRRDEMRLPEATSTELARRVDRLVAGQALRRQQQVERGAPGALKRRRQQCRRARSRAPGRSPRKDRPASPLRRLNCGRMA